MISRWFVRLRGLMTGIAIAGIGTGTMVMPLLVNPLLTAFDWRLSFIILGGLTLVVVLPAAFFLKRDPAQIGCRAFGADGDKEENTSGRAKEAGLTFRQAVQTMRFWLTAGIFFCFGIYVHTVMVHIVPQARALLPDAAGTALIMSFLGVGSIVGRVAMGSASDRIGVKYTLMISLAVIALTFVWLLSADQLWMFYLFAVAFGFGYGAMIAMQTLTMVNMFGLVSLGTMVGVITCIYTAGGSIGPVISGYIYDVTGSYRIAFLICLGLSLSGLVLALVLKGGKAAGSDVRREVKE
jgi:MFS family permease